jgi:hypothetical protein
MGIFDWLRRRTPKSAEFDFHAVFDRLAELGFMKYVHPQNYAAVREQIMAAMEQGYLEGEWDENCVSSDRRSYPADSEDLAEGQIPETILLMKDVLEREGVRFTRVETGDVENVYEVFVDDECFLVDDYTSAPGARNWALATRRLLEIVNELLRRAESDERLFGIYGGNDGQAILLTPELHDYIGTLPFIDKDWMPYRPEDINLAEYE